MELQQAVIFDVDGVLVDSYETHFQSWRQLAEEENLPLSRQQFLDAFGRTTRETLVATWPDARFSEADLSRLDQRKEQLFRELVRLEFPVMDGAGQLIASLAAAGFLLGIGSSGPRDNVDLTIAHLGLRDRLHAVVSGDDVSRGKPDPEIYRTVAERMGVPAKACLVVEDSEPGIAAAKSAGMTCVALHSSGHRRDELLRADSIINRLEELTPHMVKSFLDRSLTFSTR